MHKRQKFSTQKDRDKEKDKKGCRKEGKRSGFEILLDVFAHLFCSKMGRSSFLGVRVLRSPEKASH